MNYHVHNDGPVAIAFMREDLDAKIKLLLDEIKTMVELMESIADELGGFCECDTNAGHVCDRCEMRASIESHLSQIKVDSEV